MRLIWFKEIINDRVFFLLSCLEFKVLVWGTRSPYGQTIYVPAYSHIYSGDRERPFLLTVTVSIRNIDPNQSLKIAAVNYYETQGNLLTKFMKAPVILKPLDSIRYVIPEKDKTGGSGANFIVEWNSEKFVNPPIVESIMIGTKSGQGISFTSRGQAILTTE